MGGFAGLRTIEILRLEWKDVWFDKRVIEVGKDKAKTATRRLAPIVPALEAWLKPRAKTGPILPGIRDEFHFTKLFKDATSKLIDAKGEPLVTLVHNGLRHSFCSYRLAVTKSAAQVSLEAGNSPKMLFENYRELVTEKAAKDYFGILPEEKGIKGSKAKAKGLGNPRRSPPSSKFSDAQLALRQVPSVYRSKDRRNNRDIVRKLSRSRMRTVQIMASPVYRGHNSAKNTKASQA